MSTHTAGPRPPHRARAGRRAAAHRVVLAALGLLGLALSLTGCDERAPTSPSRRPAAPALSIAAPAGPAGEGAVAAARAVVAQGTLPLPVDQTAGSTGDLLGLTQTGAGGAGAFKINAPASFADALRAETNGRGNAVFGLANGLGAAGVFRAANPSNTAAALSVLTAGRGDAGFFRVSNAAGVGSAVNAVASGTGPALRAVAEGRGPAGRFEVTNQFSAAPAVQAVQVGLGDAIVAQSSSSRAAVFTKTSPTDVTEAVRINNSGPGVALHVTSTRTGLGRGVLIETQGGAGLQVVGGSKNAVVRTPSGARALYTEESTEVWFTDYGFGRLKHGRARVRLDPGFAETVATGEPYHVFVQPYGSAELYVARRTPGGFTVAIRGGDRNAAFSYRVVAKRLGFEAKRLEPAPWADQPPARAPR